MGCHDNITKHRFPRQGVNLNRKVEVCFHYNTDEIIMGKIIRDDRDAPFETIILLNDGRVVRAAECQYSMLITKRESPPQKSEPIAATLLTKDK